MVEMALGSCAERDLRVGTVASWWHVARLLLSWHQVLIADHDILLTRSVWSAWWWTLL